MNGPRCKFCGQEHFGLCQNLTKSKVAATAKARIEDVTARPVKLGSKGKAKKAARAKKRAKKSAKAPVAAPVPSPVEDAKS